MMYCTHEAESKLARCAVTEKILGIQLRSQLFMICSDISVGWCGAGLGLV
jgi:hypothetical protein